MRCTYTTNKKASLSIGTNAIVVLIIAVIMLGLIIGLVSTAFESIEDRFIDQVEGNEPAPPAPSSTNQMTLSSDTKRGSPGDFIGMKINIFNTDNEDDFDLTLNCGGTDNEYIANFDSSGPTVPQNEYREYLAIFQIKEGADTTTRLCTIKIKIDDENGPQASFRLTIR